MRKIKSQLQVADSRTYNTLLFLVKQGLNLNRSGPPCSHHTSKQQPGSNVQLTFIGRSIAFLSGSSGRCIRLNDWLGDIRTVLTIIRHAPYRTVWACVGISCLSACSLWYNCCFPSRWEFSHELQMVKLKAKQKNSARQLKWLAFINSYLHLPPSSSSSLTVAFTCLTIIPRLWSQTATTRVCNVLINLNI